MKELIKLVEGMLEPVPSLRPTIGEVKSSEIFKIELEEVK
jgi:hypothetical protein